MHVFLICASKTHRFWKCPFQPSSSLLWSWETTCKGETIHSLAGVRSVGTPGSHCAAAAMKWCYQFHFPGIIIPIQVFWSVWCQNNAWIVECFALWPCCKVCLAHCVPPEFDTLYLAWYAQWGYLISATLGSFFSCWQKRKHTSVVLTEYLSQVA